MGDPPQPPRLLRNERRPTRALLEERLRLATLLSQLAAGLIHVPAAALDDALAYGLGQVVRFFGADRGALDERGPVEPGTRIAWAAPGIDELPRIMEADQFPWTVARLKDDAIVRFTRTDELPPAAAADRASYERVGTRSHVSLPLHAGGAMLGVLSLDAVRDERVWSDELIERLHLLGGAFASALERRRIEVSLAQRLAFETLLSSLSTALSSLWIADFDREIEQGLRRLVEFLDIDQAALVEFSRDGDTTRTWTTGGGVTAEEDRSVHLPLVVGGAVVGGLVLGAARHERAQATREAPELQLLAEVFANALSRRQVALETQRLRQELAHIGRVSAMGELTASIAHELGQPLTAILNNAQVAQRFLEADVVNVAEVGAILNDIVADDNRATEVIRRLRRLLKKGNPEYVALDLNEVVTEVARLVMNDAAIRNVAIRLELAPGLRHVRGDRVQLQQVVLNLVLNGLDAMRPPGGRDQSLVVRTFADGAAAVSVAVCDTGIGIDPEHKAHIFEPLYTTKAEGLGMGLAIARTIVDAHGGRLTATNNAERGATVQFTLPVDRAAAR